MLNCRGEWGLENLWGEGENADCGLVNLWGEGEKAVCWALDCCGGVVNEGKKLLEGGEGVDGMLKDVGGGGRKAWDCCWKALV